MTGPGTPETVLPVSALRHSGGVAAAGWEVLARPVACRKPEASTVCTLTLRKYQCVKERPSEPSVRHTTGQPSGSMLTVANR